MSQRPSAKPSQPAWAPAKADERFDEPLIASPAPPPVSVSPCALPPVESMTPFLGTAMVQRVQAPIVATPLLEAIAEEAIAEEAIAEEAIAEEAIVLEAVAEDDIVEESPDEFTEPFFLDSDGSEEVGLAFHELTALMGSVGPVAEPVIELADSPAPTADVVAAPHTVEEVVAEVPVVVEEVVAEVSVVVDVPAPAEEVVVAEVVEVVPPAPPRGEFDDVELAVMLPSAEPPPVMMRRPATDPAALLPRRPLPQKRTSNVDELLQSFGHGSSEGGEEDDVRSTLKRLAGLEPTPPPPDATGR